jgi:hypothetical protein
LFLGEKTTLLKVPELRKPKFATTTAPGRQATRRNVQPTSVQARPSWNSSQGEERQIFQTADIAEDAGQGRDPHVAFDHPFIAGLREVEKIEVRAL